MREHYLVHLPFWDKLSTAEQNYLETKIHSKSFLKGSMVSDQTQICLALMSGDVRIYTLTDEGREITLSRLHPNDCGVLNTSIMLRQNFPDEFISIAEKDCELLLIEVNAFKKLVDSNIYVRCFWFEVAANSLSLAMESYRKALLVSVDRRVASHLLEICAETGSFVVKETASDIATAINSAREVVTRMLSKFKKMEMIEVSRGYIKITDVVKLRRIAER